MTMRLPRIAWLDTVRRMQPARYRYGPDPAQHGELWLPADPVPGTIVVIHGGFWRARYDLSLGRPLAADVRGCRRRDRPACGPAGGHLDRGGRRAQRRRPAGRLGGRPGQAAAARPGAGPRVVVTAVVSQAGVLALADCAREGVGGTAALDLMGGGPEQLPERYRLADPIAAVPVEAAVLCVHSRADDEVPFAYSERYVAAAAASGGRAGLRQARGDHYTLIDPGTPDWAMVVAALPGLIGR